MCVHVQQTLQLWMKYDYIPSSSWWSNNNSTSYSYINTYRRDKALLMRTLEVIILGTQHVAWERELVACNSIVARYRKSIKSAVSVGLLNKEREANAKHLEELLSSTQISMCHKHNQDKVERVLSI